MIDPDVVPVPAQFLGITASAIAIIVGVLNARSKQATTTGGLSSMDLVGRIDAARKEAQDAWNERNRLVEEIGELRAANKFLREGDPVGASVHIRELVTQLENRILVLERAPGMLPPRGTQ